MHKQLIVFDPKVSWGHILTIATLLVGMVAGYYQLKAEALQTRADSDREIAKLRAEIDVASLNALVLINKNSSEINYQGKVIAVQLENIHALIRNLSDALEASGVSGGPRDPRR